MRIVELFSGIGSQAKAFERLGVEYEVVNVCEWDIHAIIAYDLIHNGPEISEEVNGLTKHDLLERLESYTLSYDGKSPMTSKTLSQMREEVLRSLLSAIIKTNNLVNITDLNGADLPNDLDVLTYSFPCQDLSNMGSLHGYNRGIDRDANNRSGLLWEVERLLLERKSLNLDMPRFLLLENVTTLLADRHNGNFKDWQQCLEDLGYRNVVYKLNSNDFGIPQNRNRVLMLSIFVENFDDTLIERILLYLKNNDLTQSEYVQNLDIPRRELQDILKMNYNNSMYLLEALACQPNDTPSRRTIWERNLVIVDENNNIVADRVQTITTKQDRHPNSGNIYFSLNPSKSHFRFLTPRECFLLMGFDEIDYEAIINNNIISRGTKTQLFTRDKLYKLAGNSIVVNVLEEVFRQMLHLIEIIDDYHMDL